MINLSSFQSYNTLFNSLKQLPPLNSSGFSNVAGAYMASRYGKSINRALSTDLGSLIKNFRNDALNLVKESKNLTSQSDRTALQAKDNAAIGYSTKQQSSNTSSIRINQLATNQVNQGSLQVAKKKTDLAPGKYSLTLATENRSREVSITIQAGESNNTTLNKTAQGINGLNAGVKARVASDSLGNQQLLIESEKTGVASQFSISGTLSDAFSLHQTSQDAKDALFNYNGDDYQTESNAVTLDSGKTHLELRKETEASVDLTKSPDTSDMENKVTSLISAYNRFQDTLKTREDNKDLRAFSQELDQVITQNEASLISFGITRSATGTLEVDQEQLSKAIAEDPDQARNLFVDRDSLTTILKTKTEQQLKTPATTLLDLPKTAVRSASYQNQMINSGSVNQLSISAQSSGNLFDLLL